MKYLEITRSTARYNNGCFEIFNLLFMYNFLCDLYTTNSFYQFKILNRKVLADKNRNLFNFAYTFSVLESGATS